MVKKSRDFKVEKKKRDRRSGYINLLPRAIKRLLLPLADMGKHGTARESIPACAGPAPPERRGVLR
jgi:hypothetical protein